MKPKPPMGIDEKKRLFYEQTLQTAKEEIESINRIVEEELQALKEAVGHLQEEKDAIRQICEGACKVLGIDNVLAEEQDEDESAGEASENAED